VNHTRFPKEDHLPYSASGQQSYEGWSCRKVKQSRYRPGVAQRVPAN